MKNPSQSFVRIFICPQKRGLMLRNLIVILLLLTAYSSEAQDVVQSERLNLQATTSAIPKGSWQIESGFQYEGVSKGYYNQYYFQAPKVQQRFGISKKIELRLALSNGNVFARNHGAISSNYYLSGMEAPVFGSKIQILKQKKLVPQIAILTEVSLNPLASRLYRSNQINPNVQILLSHQLSENLLLGYNLGSYWSNYLFYTYDFYLQKKWGTKWISNIEYKGHVSRLNETRTNKMSTLFGSVGYFISPKVMGDVGLGRGVGNRPDFLFRTGLSFRLLQ